jgi:hypothetical protein
MTVTCPNGHQSQADDYCDVCGSPIDVSAQPGAAASSSVAGTTGSYAAEPAAAPRPDAAPAGSAADSAAAAEPESLECPNCEAQNPPGALFCEACGYDFTTGAMPRVAGEAAPPAQSTEGDIGDVGDLGEAKEAEQPSSLQNAPGAAMSSGQNASAKEAGSFDWLAEVWIDPDWYRTQEVDDPCPSPGLPLIIPLRSRSVLMGRVSQSRNTHPEIDLSSDPGVSRRHAQLTTDGTRWFVEDLGSSNGTFVGAAAGPLPDDPIAVGPKTELDDDDRLYVGAWSRVVVRRATPDEVDAYA